MNYQELLHSSILSFQAVSLIEKAARHDLPVLILGEKGTGKELAAKIIHSMAEGKPDRFFRMDCRILTGEDFEDQFSRLAEEVGAGPTPATLFMKEVGFLRRENQLRVLEMMEEGLFHRGSGGRTLTTVRFIASSSENLREKVSQGKFLEDLYYRFITLSIYLPPLRERTKDIPAIAQSILADHAKKMKMKEIEISDRVLRLLQSYWWPENLRELEHVLLRSAIFSEGGRITEKDLFFETGHDGNSFADFIKSSGISPARGEAGIFSEDPDSSPLPLFFVELVHRIKNPLVSIKTFTQLLRDKFSDPEFRDTFYRIVTDDIEKIDTVLNDLLGYIKVNTPLSKTNTVHDILEEVLKRHEIQLEIKRVKVFKKLEKDLPETVVQDEHLKYILNSILRFAVPSIPKDGSIGFLTKSLTPEGDRVGPVRRNGKYIEILIAFSGCKRPQEPIEAVLGIPGASTGDPIELELRLAKEMIQKNQGLMKLEVNEAKPRTLISLRFPVERRRTLYYPSAL
jgi:hypothetical protein